MTRLSVLVLADLAVVSCCATKDWLRDLVSKKEAEYGERIEGAAGSRPTRVRSK